MELDFNIIIGTCTFLYLFLNFFVIISTFYIETLFLPVANKLNKHYGRNYTIKFVYEYEEESSYDENIEKILSNDLSLNNDKNIENKLSSTEEETEDESESEGTVICHYPVIDMSADILVDETLE